VGGPLTLAGPGRFSAVERIPSAVLSTIGQTQPLAITTIFMVSPMPANSMITGTGTGGGTARRRSDRLCAHRTRVLDWRAGNLERTLGGALRR